MADTDPADGPHRLEFAWDDVHVNRIGHRRDEVPAVPGGPALPDAVPPPTHTQVLMPLDIASVMVVAPPGVPFTSASDAAAAEAFVLQPLEAVVLHRGTWHWGPFPVQGRVGRALQRPGPAVRRGQRVRRSRGPRRPGGRRARLTVAAAAGGRRGRVIADGTWLSLESPS